MNEFELDRLIRTALTEDIGAGDWTTAATVAAGTPAAGVLRSREAGVVAGLEVARRVFAVLDPRIQFQNRVTDGNQVERGTVLAEVSGAARPILTGERVALNFLCHLSGIATRTRRLKELVAGYPVRLVDTRKTTPGLRMLEKYAVRVGGGHNHRFALDDGVLIKDNHIAVAGGITAAVRAARAAVHHLLKIEVEVEDLDGVREALAAGADVILLDNMPPPLIKEAVRLVGGRAVLEASGNVDEQNIREIAATGVNLISLGRLTHSVPYLDIGLDLDAPGAQPAG
ncbi:carboxylating nicotinate-nucleotide diphosphorylase [Candidatus Desulforudis audaxviator]|uniref:Probable nicotinate-nucleotide pyrophosphorylase [carboxylating] n=1 Tax=Desulforudis audaxviator (strain MP104C) TaxID=477974 RepID=B1I1G6_DESAP|nr:carboxylating nicotinate-nucleotide diphosphorylase [Candidatus Desulforudis audaxviator]ACA58691.1 nicotinate-nucleotide pyrophosphorylase [Candidatus Desulforudis audaxviator MP104C]AZK58691.1 Quinolinate phosphoribosyltransferase [decarboxylating] [Candidatus Desulforudis audaxviator]